MGNKLPISIKLPDNFLNEENIIGYNVSTKMKKVWAIELDMLMELDRVCKQLNVRYFLDSGTLLGAVRNGHFIAWDDDIDVVMLREDYDVFLREAPLLFHPPLFLQNPYTDPTYYRLHSQLRNSETTAILATEYGVEIYNQGIFLDIFPLDGVDRTKMQRQFSEREKLLRGCTCLVHYNSGSFKKRIAKTAYAMVLKARGLDKVDLWRKAEDIFRRSGDTEYIEKMSIRKEKQRIYEIRREWYDETTEIQFEGLVVPAPRDYDAVLTAMYGNSYMTPKQMKSGHNIEGDLILDPEKSYIEYQK